MKQTNKVRCKSTKLIAILSEFLGEKFSPHYVLWLVYLCALQGTIRQFRQTFNGFRLKVKIRVVVATYSAVYWLNTIWISTWLRDWFSVCCPTNEELFNNLKNVGDIKYYCKFTKNILYIKNIKRW